jgi:hypothetical protein
VKLIPLLDHSGSTKAWADRQTGWIGDLAGNIFALVKFYGVFSRTSAQIGWFGDGYIQDRLGGVVLFISGRRIEHLIMPQPQKIPQPPTIAIGPSSTAMVALAAPQKTALGGFCDIL